MTGTLLRYNKEPLKIEMDKVSRICGLSQSNLIVVMKNEETHTGYMFKFD